MFNSSIYPLSFLGVNQCTEGASEQSMKYNEAQKVTAVTQMIALKGLCRSAILDLSQKDV